MDCNDYIAGTGNHNISSLFEDTDRQLWIGTEDKGINRLDLATGNVSHVACGHPGHTAHLVTLAMYTHAEYVYYGLFKQGLEVIHTPTHAPSANPGRQQV